MGATSVTGVGTGSAPLVTTSGSNRAVSESNPRISKLVLTGNNSQDVVLTNVSGKLSANNTNSVGDIRVLGTFKAADSPYSLLIEHFNRFANWQGGGLWFAPATSDYEDGRSCCFGCTCCCWCRISSRARDYVLLCANPEEMTELDLYFRFRFSKINISSLVNIETFQMGDLHTDNYRISGFSNLEDLELWHSSISDDLVISQNPNLNQLYFNRVQIDQSKLAIDFNTLTQLYDVQFANSDLSIDTVDNLFIGLADSLNVNPRVEGYVNFGGNNGISDKSLEARAALVDADWSVSY